MVIMMVGVVFTEMYFARGFQKYIILGVLSEIYLSGTSSYLDDVLHPAKALDGDHAGLSDLH